MMRVQRPAFYGWVVVAGCFIAMLCMGEVMWSFGVFFKALQGEFGWSRSVTSSCYTFMVVGYAISAIVAGRLSDRYSARPVLIVSALLAGPAIALCSQIETVLQLQLLLFAAGLGAGVLLSVPSSTVQRWFHNRPRSAIALALVMTGVGVGALVFAPVINHIIATTGWRQAFVFAGLFYFIAVTVAAVLVRPLPRWSSEPSGAGGTHHASSTVARQLVRTPRFIALVAVLMASVFSFQVLSVHLVPLATDAGISPEIAAAALGLAGAFSVVGRLVCGLVSGRIGWRWALALAEIGIGVAVLFLLVVDEAWMLYCFVGVYGLAQGVRAVSVSGVIGCLFGMRAIGELIGIAMACAQLTAALGPYAAGYLHDVLGSYTLILWVIGISLLVCAVVVLKFLVAPVEKGALSEEPTSGV